MAACGTCHREIVWAILPGGEKVALDGTASYDAKERYTLHHRKGYETPQARRVNRPSAYFAGHQRHENVCGKGIPV